MERTIPCSSFSLAFSLYFGPVAPAHRSLQPSRPTTSSACRSLVGLELGGDACLAAAPHVSPSHTLSKQGQTTTSDRHRQKDPRLANGCINYRMGLKLNGRYISLVLAVQLAYLVQAVRAAGKCDAVFEDFSGCVVTMGKSIAGYQQDPDDKRNLETICQYWDEFHLCTLRALTDCQEGVKDVWEKLKEKSKKLDYEGNLFVLCSRGPSKGGASISLTSAPPLLLLVLSAAWATWFSF